MKVLVIEDDEQISYIYRQALEFEGCLTMAASTAQEAATILVAIEFDVVLTDYLLPDGNGIDLIAKFKPMFPSTKFILSSAEHGLESTADQVLNKPLDYNTLVSILK